MGSFEYGIPCLFSVSQPHSTRSSRRTFLPLTIFLKYQCQCFQSLNRLRLARRFRMSVTWQQGCRTKLHHEEFSRFGSLHNQRLSTASASPRKRERRPEDRLSTTLLCNLRAKTWQMVTITLCAPRPRSRAPTASKTRELHCGDVASWQGKRVLGEGILFDLNTNHNMIM